MPGDSWKEAANKRRDFRQARNGPAVPPHRPRKLKKEKPFRLEKKLRPGHKSFFWDEREWKLWCRYAKKEDAEPAAEPQVDYDDFLAKLREEAGEAEQTAELAAAGSGLPAAGRGIPVSPEVMAWMRSAKIHVTRAWVLAPGFRTQPLSTEIRVRLSAGGEVLGTRVVRRSGNPWYDESVERAIKKASPLPPPPEADEWLFVFRPEDVL